MRFHYAFFVGAMRATEIIPAGLDAVPNDFAPAMFAFGREGVDGAFKTIVVVGDAVDDNLDVFVVIVSANFTMRHKKPLVARYIKSNSAFDIRRQEPQFPSLRAPSHDGKCAKKTKELSALRVPFDLLPGPLHHLVVLRVLQALLDHALIFGVFVFQRLAANLFAR